MSRRLSVAIAVMLFAASVPILGVSNPVITGTISGIELCPQSICGQAVFAGSFTGPVSGKVTPGVFWTGITHEALPTTVGGMSAITGGTWLIRTPKKVFFGVVPEGGTLTYNGGNTYTVALTMELSQGGSGTLTFEGVLNHNLFPPTIVGTLSQ
jgi:hypothetical protein